MSEEIQDVTPKDANVEYGVENETFEQDSKGEEITLSDFGDEIKESAKNTSSKPIFEKNTKATVRDVKLTRMFEPTPTRDGKDEYYQILVKIETETDEGIKSFDSYGGLRLTSDNHLWCGPKSAFGKLKGLILEEIGDDATWEEVFDFLKPGLNVKIKTETTSFNDKKYQKNIIKQIL